MCFEERLEPGAVKRASEQIGMLLTNRSRPSLFKRHWVEPWAASRDMTLDGRPAEDGEEGARLDVS